MTRLTDADALMEIYARYEFTSDMGDAMEILANFPTVDAVPVIRCKDCKWFGKIGCAISIVDDTDKPSENDYCSFAERKEE